MPFTKSKKMKIIIISPSLNPNINVSGISSVTHFIIKRNTQHEYIHFELGKKDNEHGGIFRIFIILKCLLQWYKLLSMYKDAIIHYNFPLSKKSILRDSIFIWIAYKRKYRMIIHIHGGIFLTASHTPAYLNFLLNKIFKLPIPFIVLSKTEEEILKKRFNCKNINILPNCPNINEDKSSIIERTNYNGTLNIGYLGRISETKGMDYLLQACIEMKKQQKSFMLKIAGKEELENQYLPKFKKELTDHFTYEGIVSGKSKISFLQSLDIFILPSYFEGLPMALLESMSAGVVPVTTNVGSINEIIKDGVNGLFIQCKESKSIIEQISKLDNNRDLLCKLSKNAQHTIRTKFNSDEYIRKLNEIYNSVN